MPPLLAPLSALLASLSLLGEAAPVGWLVAVVAGAMAPDVDLLLLLVHPASAVRLHRGPTHSLVGLVVLGALAGVLVRATGGPPLATSVGLALAGVLVHALFDWLSIHGLALSIGSRGRRVALPVLVSLDPWLTGLWVVAAAAAIAFPSGTRVVAGIGLAAGMYVVALRIHFRGRAKVAAREALATPVEGVFPRPESPARWTVVTRTVAGVQAGVLDLGTRRLSMFASLPEAAGSALLVSALAQAVVERAVYPVTREAGSHVCVRDLRFAYDWPSPPFGADVELDAEGRPLRERAYL